MSFELTVATAPAWVTAHGLNPGHIPLTAVELTGGVSASVIAVNGHGVAVVVKQALSRLRVAELWEAKVERTESEVAAMRLFAELTPGAVPAVLAHDAADHVFAMEQLPIRARNWQAEIGQGRVNLEIGRWAGLTLGTWHAETSTRPDILDRFDDFEAFEQQRLTPFYETVIARRPELGTAIGAYATELRSVRSCLVDGDYAPKNMLVARGGQAWVFDFEVVHVGNPVFDLAFFLSFAVLSAIRWPPLTDDLRRLAGEFLSGYEEAAGNAFVDNAASITGHTACLVLARTDGTSPAQFLDEASRQRARDAGVSMLERPQAGLWSWV